jgi:hypothetical protein
MGQAAPSVPSVLFRNCFIPVQAMQKRQSMAREQKMINTLNLYLDDSGTRHPSRNPGRKPEHGYDWFALGGVLVREEDETEARLLHANLIAKWEITTPLHSSEIRSQNEDFFWLRGKTKAEQAEFYEDLYCLMRDAPVTGIACVIDRPGYNARYAQKYNENPWMLCKTSFSVVVERAAKFAISQGRKLRVLPEKCNKPEDTALSSYYQELRTEGLPFDAGNSGKYAPLSKEEFGATLYDLKFKAKSSPMAQFADLYLWPVCMGGYHRGNMPYKRLLEDGKLIECLVSPDQHPTLGSKYSCFEGVEIKE